MLQHFHFQAVVDALKYYAGIKTLLRSLCVCMLKKYNLYHIYTLYRHHVFFILQSFRSRVFIPLDFRCLFSLRAHWNFVLLRYWRKWYNVAWTQYGYNNWTGMPGCYFKRYVQSAWNYWHSSRVFSAVFCVMLYDYILVCSSRVQKTFHKRLLLLPSIHIAGLDERLSNYQMQIMTHSRTLWRKNWNVGELWVRCIWQLIVFLYSNIGSELPYIFRKKGVLVIDDVYMYVLLERFSYLA